MEMEKAAKTALLPKLFLPLFLLILLFYFDKACDLGMLQACEALQQLKKMKVAMPPITQRRGLYVHDY